MAARERDDVITNDLMISAPRWESEMLQEIAKLVTTSPKLGLIGEEGKPLSIPESLREGMSRLATFLADGSSVAIQPYEQTITTQQAADLLHMSRPYLIRLIEEQHIIPLESAHQPGKHRRLRLSDVLAYRDGRTLRAVIEGHREMATEKTQDAGRETMRLAHR